jgi:hypothetical protein
VAVNFHAGSHYITLSMLAGSMNSKSEVRYVAPRPYTREEYEHLHDWMSGWGLLDPQSGYDRIVGATPTTPVASLGDPSSGRRGARPVAG